VFVILKRAITVGLIWLFKNHVYTSRHGLAKGLRRKGGLAWLPSFVPRSRRILKEEEALASLDLSGQTIYDIGGDQGTYTLFFARKAGTKGRVITFEPNAVSHSRIVTNVTLNGFQNVEVRNLALGEKQGTLRLAFPGNDPGRGSVDELTKAQILKEVRSKSTEVEVDALDRLIPSAGLPKPNFAKIDVEGFELDVLKGMKNTLTKQRPQLFIEIHGADMKAKLENIRRVTSFLFDLRYKIYHIESEQEITGANVDDAREGHIYCTPAD
jgi:FkbM family methyltransferase